MVRKFVGSCVADGPRTHETSPLDEQFDGGKECLRSVSGDTPCEGLGFVIGDHRRSHSGQAQAERIGVDSRWHGVPQIMGLIEIAYVT